MTDFQGKRVLITGGTSGIGLALADAFLAEGASVAVCARNLPALQEFQKARPGTLALQADVTDPAAQAALLDQVAAGFGGLDILVNNAGRLIERDFLAAAPPAGDLAAELTLNLVAPVQLTAQVLARYRSLDAIILISSGFALVSPRRSPTYGAAKAGLHGFADGLRRQLQGGPTHVLEVLPPVVDTPATAHRQVRKVTPAAVAAQTLRALRARQPMALVGATRFLPTLLRLAPGAAGRLVGNL